MFGVLGSRDTWLSVESAMQRRLGAKHRISTARLHNKCTQTVQRQYQNQIALKQPLESYFASIVLLKGQSPV